MKFKGLYTAFTAASLIAAPTLAAAAPVATPLTQPAGETVDGDNALAGSSLIIAILAVGAIAGGIVAAASNNDSPTSP
ncbi:hypothetical protein [Sphingomonas sp. TREG-RG-20F-R18-01]|uniref:hypothetical protein n=1 Tax=Sphingomonas sp. TREG-RG-20F-R18-01 TaxID=2914982 RepID=UPI001F592C3D|nr:hypothetical protein [Sphingomonas sp. TREG-RG-20F-R18-01]